jgi:hypothetical protein
MKLARTLNWKVGKAVNDRVRVANGIMSTVCVCGTVDVQMLRNCGSGRWEKAVLLGSLTGHVEVLQIACNRKQPTLCTELYHCFIQYMFRQ